MWMRVLYLEESHEWPECCSIADFCSIPDFYSLCYELMDLFLYLNLCLSVLCHCLSIPSIFFILHLFLVLLPFILSFCFVSSLSALVFEVLPISSHLIIYYLIFAYSPQAHHTFLSLFPNSMSHFALPGYYYRGTYLYE